MINFGINDIDTIMSAGREVVSVMFCDMVIWQSGNFRTSDGFIFQTADNNTFNVKE